MKICFDHEVFSIQKIGGVSRYFSEIILRLLNFENLDIRIDCKFTNNLYLNHLKKNLTNKIYNIDLNPKVTSFLNDIFVKIDDYDIHHKTYYSKKYNKKIPTIITIHDLISEKYSNNSSFMKADSEKKKFNIDIADHIIAVSNKTKNDLIKYYDINPNKISVIYHGFNFTKIPYKYSLNFKPNKPYFLFIGNRYFYKNFDILLETFSQYRHLLIDFDLICVGSNHFTNSELKFMKEKNIDINSIKNINKVSDYDLINLYRNAICLIFPSYDEGFGIPIIEALSQNCPVICSDIEVFREIFEDYVYYFDPYDHEDLFSKIDLILSNNSFKRKDKELDKFLNKFSWEIAAEKTLDVYKKI